jgi:hypothetical protein
MGWHTVEKTIIYSICLGDRHTSPFYRKTVPVVIHDRPSRLCLLNITSVRLLRGLALLECIRLILVRHHRYLLHQPNAEQADARNANHHIPHNPQAVSERALDLSLERLGECLDHWDRGEGNLNATRELGRERGGQAGLQFVLEHGAGNGDTPGVGERADERKERERCCVRGDG